MNTLFEWDELNLIRHEATVLWSGKPPDRKKREEFCDWLEFVLCLVYAYGWQDAEKVIGPVKVEWNHDTEVVNLVIAGMTFRDRVMTEDTAEEIVRIIDTEAHRDYNAGVVNAAEESGMPNLRKRWYTMMDDRVRDTHDYLEGMVVGIDDRFYTYDGDSARYPGDFDDPKNNVNCRCSVGIVP